MQWVWFEGVLRGGVVQGVRGGRGGVLCSTQSVLCIPWLLAPPPVTHVGFL